MANIYELKNEFNTLWAILENEEADEASIVGAFETATDDLAEKLENCCKYIANEKAIIAGLKAEEERIYARRKAKENALERLKALMLDAMTAAGEKKLACGTFTCSVQANPPRAIIDVAVADIPTKYLIPQAPTVDKKAILADLKENPSALASIAHLEQAEGIRIR